MLNMTVSKNRRLSRRLQAIDALPKRDQEAIRSRRVGRLFSTIDKLTNLTPPLTEQEIQAEIEAARAERRSQQHSSGN